MEPKAILQRVNQYYESPGDPLLLSDLGTLLRDEKLWPIEGIDQSLSEYIGQNIPELELIKDPESIAFVMVVPADKKSLAEATIERRQRTRFLKLLPRAVILAFCVTAPPGQDVFLRLEPPVRYEVGGKPDDGSFILVEEEYRSPGIFMDDERNLEPSVAERLVEGVRKWARKHGVNFERKFARDLGLKKEPVPPTPQKSINALERLYAAQNPDFARQLIVPLDIAITLSRLT